MSEPFAPAFTTAVANRGLSLEGIRRRLVERGAPVSVATLSYWRSGRRRPEGPKSLAVVEALEEVLDLQPGELMSQLGPSRRPRPVSHTVSYSDLHASGKRIEAGVAQLGVIQRPNHRDLFSHRTLTFTGENDITVRVKLLSEIVADNVVSRTVGSVLREGQGDSRSPIRVLGGCRLGRDVKLPEEGVTATQLVYDRVMNRGDLVMVEYELDLRADALDGNNYDMHLNRRVGEAVLWVRFDPEHPPVSVTRYVETTDARTETVERGERALSVIHVVKSAGPGRVGVGWEFPAS